MDVKSIKAKFRSVPATFFAALFLSFTIITPSFSAAKSNSADSLKTLMPYSKKQMNCHQ